MIKTIHFYGKIVALVLALAIVGFLFPAQYTHASTIYGGNTANPITGVSSASSTALDTNLATNLAGESAFFNRLMTLLFNCTPLATTTDSNIVAGEANLAWYWVSGPGASSSVLFYDALTNTGTPALAEWGINISSTTAPFSFMPQRLVGAHFSTGLTVDVTLNTNQVLNLCYL